MSVTVAGLEINASLQYSAFVPWLENRFRNEELDLDEACKLASKYREQFLDNILTFVLGAAKLCNVGCNVGHYYFCCH